MASLPNTKSPRRKRIDWYTNVLTAAAERGSDVLVEAKRRLAREDLFFLLVYVLGRNDINRDWLFARCMEVQASPNGHLDLWAREHYKSTIITFGKTIQDILTNPNVTIGIFSHTRPIAKGFLRQIKREFEGNTVLRELFADIIWDKPHAHAPKWSEDDGLIVRRDQNPKEATVEAWGLVDGMPTGKHFAVLVYDDVVTDRSVTNPDMIKKTTDAWSLSLNLGAHGGARRIIGTRYHFNDTYRTILDRQAARPRIYPATVDGQMDGAPVFLTREQLRLKRRDQGPYIFGCFVGDTPVLMSDWSEKPVVDVCVGDEVVGYTFPQGKKSSLTPSKVLAKKDRVVPVVRYVFESGRSIVGTVDHKFYTGRRGMDVGGTDNHNAYAPLGWDRRAVGGAIPVYDPRSINRCHDAGAASYLAGIFDGEGATSGGCIHIHQSRSHNPAVCERIEQTLAALGFDWGAYEKARRGKVVVDYYIRGGRAEIIRFLNVCRPAKSRRISEWLYERGTRNFGKAMRDKLVSVEELGEARVYNIQTETGNYIAGGYAVKNCQMLQNPVADRAQGFDLEWLKAWSGRDWAGMNLYIVVDPSSGKKVGDTDYTTMQVIGIGEDGNYYWIAGVRDRLNLTQRGATLMRLHREFRPKGVGYEQYGLQADIEYIETLQDAENYRFDITPLGGKLSKTDRIRRLVPVMEGGRWYMPAKHQTTTTDSTIVDVVQEFRGELDAFPVGAHDDLIDGAARILDPEMNAKIPESAATRRGDVIGPDDHYQDDDYNPLTYAG